MVGIFAWYGIPVPFEARMKAIRKAGFDSTSIWIDNDHHEDLSADDIPDVVRASGLILDYAHAPYRKYCLYLTASRLEYHGIADSL